MLAVTGKRVNVVVETPRGSRNTFCYVPDFDAIRLGKQLPRGSRVPLRLRFIPSTRAGDGDPLDVLVQLDAPTCPGCLVKVRLLGVIEGHASRKVFEPTG